MRTLVFAIICLTSLGCLSAKSVGEENELELNNVPVELMAKESAQRDDQLSDTVVSSTTDPSSSTTASTSGDSTTSDPSSSTTASTSGDSTTSDPSSSTTASTSGVSSTSDPSSSTTTSTSGDSSTSDPSSSTTASSSTENPTSTTTEVNYLPEYDEIEFFSSACDMIFSAVAAEIAKEDVLSTSRRLLGNISLVGLDTLHRVNDPDVNVRGSRKDVTCPLEIPEVKIVPFGDLDHEGLVNMPLVGSVALSLRESKLKSGEAELSVSEVKVSVPTRNLIQISASGSQDRIYLDVARTMQSTPVKGYHLTFFQKVVKFEEVINAFTSSQKYLSILF